MIGQNITAQEALTLLQKTDARMPELIEKLEKEQGLSKNEYVYMIQHMNEEAEIVRP